MITFRSFEIMKDKMNRGNDFQSLVVVAFGVVAAFGVVVVVVVDDDPTSVLLLMIAKT